MDAVLNAGETYELSLGEAEKTDIGRWEITIDASTEGGQYSSDSTSFSIAAAEPLTTLIVDIWTDKGGRGRNMPGGTYKVGEGITVHLEVTTTCQATWTLNGPTGTDSGEQMMYAGTYELNLGRAKEGDVGRWQMIFEAWTDGQSDSDSTSFTIIAAGSEPTPTPAPTPSEPEEEPIPKIDASNATELYALMALKMSEGALPVDLNLDANADGQVTREDARLILGWAVDGS